MEIVVESPQDMNLLGLFIKEALDARRDALARSRATGSIGLTAGTMSVTLSFEPDRTVIHKGIVGSPKAQLTGSLESLVAIARGRIAPTLLSRRARISGNPMAALPLARVFRSDAPLRSGR